MHENLEKLEPFQGKIYAISKDNPNELKQLSDAIKEQYPRDDELEITFLSDPKLQLIEYMNMKNEDTAYRGFGMLDPEGKTLFVHINDHWGEELDQTIEKMNEEYAKWQNQK